jgi:3-carboxy-cis,cis-muconate cycloisomerase
MKPNTGNVHFRRRQIIDGVGQPLTLRDWRLADVRLAALTSAFGMLADRFWGSPMMERTRMQAALPIKVSDRLVSVEPGAGAHRKRLGSRAATRGRASTT